MPALPISEYPEIVPPTVVVSGQYPRRLAQDHRRNRHHAPRAADQRRRECDLHEFHRHPPDGTFSITVTFKLGTDLDIAQVQTQNRVAQAETRLPDVVRQIGLVTQKRSPDLTMVVFLRSKDGRYDSLYLRNYAVIQIRDVLARLHGMGDVRVFGSGDYAMRLWLDPGKIAARSMGRERGAGGGARAERAGGGRPDRRPAVAAGDAVRVHRQCPGPAADRTGVRRHRREDRRQRRDHLSARHCAPRTGT